MINVHGDVFDNKILEEHERTFWNEFHNTHENINGVFKHINDLTTEDKLELLLSLQSDKAIIQTHSFERLYFRLKHISLKPDAINKFRTNRDNKLETEKKFTQPWRNIIISWRDDLVRLLSNELFTD